MQQGQIYTIASVTRSLEMTTFLQSPEKTAPRQDWLMWLEELKDMPRTAAVQTAIRTAERTLANMRDKGNRQKSRNSEALAYA